MRKLLWPLLAIIPSIALANVAEFFGTNHETVALGGQASEKANDGANNFYVPAMLAYADKISLTYALGHINHSFEDISNIVIENSTNSSNSSLSGNGDTDYDSVTYNSIHAVLPIKAEIPMTLGISVFTPMGYVLETSSGDAVLPEYVMYRARYKRTTAYANLAYAYSDTLAFSVGTLLGIQAGANASANISLNGTSYGSSASAKSKVTPSLGVILSVYKDFFGHKTYFTYMQEMKSNIGISAITEVNEVSVPSSNSIEAMLAYDPHIFRFGYMKDFKLLKLNAMLEYQIWSGYVTPVVRIKKIDGAVLATDNYEAIKAKNILVPRVGITVPIGEKWDVLAGASYRPTHLEGDFSGPGNSIDVDSYTLSTGFNHRLSFLSKHMELGLGIQYRNLKERTVTKTSGQENGNAGSKIGAPGYKVGGNVLMVNAGINVEF